LADGLGYTAPAAGHPRRKKTQVSPSNRVKPVFIHDWTLFSRRMGNGISSAVKLLTIRQKADWVSFFRNSDWNEGTESFGLL